jgi:hypothetical protein
MAEQIVKSIVEKAVMKEARMGRAYLLTQASFS